ncbi:hypothetical protein FQA47_016894 [Oryzias melastigma]|uniref:Uncharacterized protein n=1 Tax=Oryzias melastigma TaxID=30732 RepID=A0A834EWL1_ORYME|nr:hypothetical protein FQA47_016894 [Oryzias melastigma]
MTAVSIGMLRLSEEEETESTGRRVLTGRKRDSGGSDGDVPLTCSSLTCSGGDAAALRSPGISSLMTSALLHVSTSVSACRGTRSRCSTREVE